MTLPRSALLAAKGNFQLSNPVLILASGSPRRKELLGQLGLVFEVQPANVDESVRLDESPMDYVSRLSREKASLASQNNPSAVVIAADTSVVVDSTILGKPGTDEALGKSMLKSLSGKAHVVMTGVTVKRGPHIETRVVSTAVVMKQMTQAEINWYVGTKEGADKAGGYALQGLGAAFVVAINGSSTNVIGLPLLETLEMLKLVKFNLPWAVPAV
jgi:septum formation protein